MRYVIKVHVVKNGRHSGGQYLVSDYELESMIEGITGKWLKDSGLSLYDLNIEVGRYME